MSTTAFSTAYSGSADHPFTPASSSAMICAACAIAGVDHRVARRWVFSSFHGGMPKRPASRLLTPRTACRRATSPTMPDSAAANSTYGTPNCIARRANASASAPRPVSASSATSNPETSAVRP